jgi:hypothetical protein
MLAPHACCLLRAWHQQHAQPEPCILAVTITACTCGRTGPCTRKMPSAQAQRSMLPAHCAPLPRYTCMPAARAPRQRASSIHPQQHLRHHQHTGGGGQIRPYTHPLVTQTSSIQLEHTTPCADTAAAQSCHPPAAAAVALLFSYRRPIPRMASGSSAGCPSVSGLKLA